MTLAEQVQEHFNLANQAYAGGELDFMCDTFAEVQPECLYEWGTGSGASGRIFQECASILGLACLVHTTELPDELSPLEEQHPREYTGQHLNDGAIRKRGDGVTESLIAWSQMRPSRSLWFLDGDHSLYACYREIALIDRMVPGAVMLLHDTNSGPGGAARSWVEHQGKNRFTSIAGRTGIGRLDPL